MPYLGKAVQQGWARLGQARHPLGPVPCSHGETALLEHQQAAPQGTNAAAMLRSHLSRSVNGFLSIWLMLTLVQVVADTTLHQEVCVQVCTHALVAVPWIEGAMDNLYARLPTNYSFSAKNDSFKVSPQGAAC